MNYPETENNSIDDCLRQLVQQKQADVKTDAKGEDQYKLTEQGLKQTEDLIKGNEDYQLLLFTLTFNMESEKQGVKTSGDKFVALKKTLDFMAQFNPNFFSVFERAVSEGKIQGIKKR
jgi:hypothetical protein